MDTSTFSPIYNQLRYSLKSLKNTFDRMDCDLWRPLSDKAHMIKGFASINFPRAYNLQLPLKCFLDCLEIIPASPKRKPLFEKIYVFPNENMLKDAGATTDINTNRELLRDSYSPIAFANVSDEWLDELLNHFIETCHRLRREKRSRAKIISRTKKDSIFFCIGEPGIGKTTFINNMFSTRAERLRKEKIIWIRLDLNDPSQRRYNFEDSFLIKIITILREFYTEEIDFNSKALRGYIQQKWSASTERSAITVADIEILFRKFFTLRPYNIERQLDLAFIDIVIDYLMEELGYGFIYIIDGLDRVSLDSVRNVRFSEWCKNLVEFITNKRFKDAVYIVSMREISLIDAISNFSEDENLRKPKMLKVIPPDLHEMITQKFKLAKEMIQEGIADGYNWMSQDHVDSLSDAILLFTCCSILNRRIDTVSSDNFDEVIREGIQLLDGICAKNYRALMRFFRQLLLYVFSYYNEAVEDLINADIGRRFSCLIGREYKVKRALSFGREESFNYSVPYKYYLNKGKLTFRPAATVEALIPDVFNFIDVLETGETEHNQQNRALVKLRVVQLLLKNNLVMKKQRIIDYLNSHLGYSKFFLDHEIDEMIFSGMLYPKSLADFVRAGNYTLKLTTLGQYIYDNLIYENVYLEIVVDDTPLPFSTMKFIDPINMAWIGVDADAYVATKIRSVLYFLAMLRELERQEEEYFNSVEDYTGKSFQEHGFKVVGKMEASIQAHIKRVISERVAISKRFVQVLENTFRIKIKPKE